VNVHAFSWYGQRVEEGAPVLVVDDLSKGRATPVTESVLTALLKCRMTRGKVRIITSNYGMAEALTGIDKKQDAEAISRRIHEKGSIRVIERRRANRAA
jgi:DNA replication protein DnaC